jgi:deazaflavin-dependent oxidoreductase (nitroreductase family)
MKLMRSLMKRLGHRRWFAALARPVLARMDRLAFWLTRGRFAPTAMVAPVLLLTTTGRRSGKQRTTPVMYVRVTEGFVISSEDIGQERRAAWPLNLEADPGATVRVGRQTWACRARPLNEDEIGHYWEKLVVDWPAHETYRQRSGRRHTFLLEPTVDNARPERLQGSEVESGDGVELQGSPAAVDASRG